MLFYDVQGTIDPMDVHEQMMKKALQLARKGLGHTSPNPMVGAVIVASDNGRVLAEGFHKAAGQAHAEVNALAALPVHSALDSAVLYVTLEPCNHHGRTPPCSEAIIASGIRSVVIGAADVNPLTAGKGIARLKAAGIAIVDGVCTEDCVSLNKRYYTNQLLKRPYVVLKWAETKDGFIARTDGSSKWISSQEARSEVHRMRSIEDGILIGSNTACTDNPELTVRHVAGENPTRILLDSRLATPADNNIFDLQAQTIIFNKEKNDNDTLHHWIKENPRDLPAVLRTLLSNNINSILVEGGSAVLQSFIDANLWDEAVIFVGDQNFEDGIAAPSLTRSHNSSQNFGDTQAFYVQNPAINLYEHFLGASTP